MRNDDPLAAVDTTVGIVDDRVSMSADGDANVYVDAPNPAPLSYAETHATIRVSGDGFRATIELDGAEAELLLEALEEAVDDA